MAVRQLAALLASLEIDDLRRGGREIGYAMVRRDPDLIEALRDAISDVARAAAEPTPEQALYARGYHAALRRAAVRRRRARRPRRARPRRRRPRARHRRGPLAERGRRGRVERAPGSRLGAPV